MPINDHNIDRVTNNSIESSANSGLLKPMVTFNRTVTVD